MILLSVLVSLTNMVGDCHALPSIDLAVGSLSIAMNGLNEIMNEFLDGSGCDGFMGYGMGPNFL